MSEQLKQALDLIKRLQERIKKLENIEHFATKTIEKQEKEIEKQQYILMGVMHSVDKWLDGDELKQDEVNRAATMREKTLQITEKQSAEIERLNVELVGMRGACESYRIHYDIAQAEIKRLNGRVEATEISKQKLLSCFKTAKSEAIKEFVKKFEKKIKDVKFTIGQTWEIQCALKQTLKEMTEVSENVC